ncbi:MAG: TonB-dependent receptor [Azoarcus sp.]|jgi:iron complex outermembrane receptor protein|nr:TonB-dependent receptor [Azoarcus sp.]
MLNSKIWLWAMPLALTTLPAHGDDTVLNPIVVTAKEIGDSMGTTPHTVSVITRKDIEASTAQTLGELLTSLPNVHLHSLFEGDRRASIDIRGMGDTALSNVVILVDGVRLNEIDMSGSDLTTVPLAQIERIEILRGGGAVRHGDGAVGGVIDIRTRGGRGGNPHGDVAFKMGSDKLRELQAQAGAGVGALRIGATYRRFQSNGYRDNGKTDARDGTLDLRVTLGPVEAWLRGASHFDHSGLPGPVSREAFKAGDRERRSTNAPKDFSETDDDRLSAGTALDLGAGGIVELRAGLRTRRNPYGLGYDPSQSASAQKNKESKIETDHVEYSLLYTLHFNLGREKQTLRAGYDALDGDYLRAENGHGRNVVVDQSKRLEGRVHSKAGYLELTSGLGAGLTLQGGYRQGRFQTNPRQSEYKKECDYQPTWVNPPGIWLPVPVNCRDEWKAVASHRNTWTDRASTLGLSWHGLPSLTVFASASSHFRNPNIDELMLASDTLRPQRGLTLEHGLRYHPNARLQLGATLFWMRTKDEIYYGEEPSTHQTVNRNYDDITRRFGIELEMRWQAHDRVALRGGFGYVKPIFVGSGADIPHVPRRTASASIDIALPGQVNWTLAGRYVGSRYDGNDIDNTQYPRLPSYTLLDTALRVKFGKAQVVLGISNLTNKVYSALGYSGSFYPMPGRTFYGAVSGTF